MPRERDIGWQHGKMIGGCRHHLQCNYCQRIMIGGITRFKKHLACKKGEVRGCDAVPEEVRNLIKKHLAAIKMRKTTRTRQHKEDKEVSSADSSEDGDIELDESDREVVVPGPESSCLMTKPEANPLPLTNENQPLMMEAQEFFDAFAANQHNVDQVLAPPRATDPGWDHGIMINGGRQKIKCKYCLKVILGGGISRLKQHLAGERGNVVPCEAVPEEVKQKIQQHLGLKVLEKLKRQKELQSIRNSASSPQSSEREHCEQKNSKVVLKGGSSRKRTRKVVDGGILDERKKHEKLNSPVGGLVMQHPSELSLPSQEIIDLADMAVARFFFDAAIPFSASNSPYFQKMADAIAAAGPGYKVPPYHSLRGKLLNRSLQHVVEQCREIRRSWDVTGCSVMVDRWSDKTGRTVLNFFVYCPKGTIFLKSVDATAFTNSSDALIDMFDSVVQEVGPQNIVNFMTDTSPSYKAAGKALMEKYRTFFWSACTSHCIDLMLEQLGEKDGVKTTLIKAKKITQFIYNNTWVLNLMRKLTGGSDIVQLAKARYVSSFRTLQRIASLKDTLHQMFTSPVWLQSNFSKQKAAFEVVENVIDPQFWYMCEHILKIANPLLLILPLADCKERPSMGLIYDAIQKAKESIIMAFNNEQSDCMQYLDIIDRIWQEELHSPLHAAGCYLNPSLFYNASLSMNKIVQKGLLDCIETLEPNITFQVMITNNINFYKDAVGDFGRPMALHGRESLDPATWWSLYAADCPDLQRIAIRVLSQTCSITQCKRTWSTFERIHEKERNCLEHQRLNDLLFVHCNLALQERREASKSWSIDGAYDPICLETMDAYVSDWVEDPGSYDGDDLGLTDVAVSSGKIYRF